MESLGTSPKRNDGGDGRPWGVAAQSWAAAPATLTEKRAMKKEEEEEKVFQLSKVSEDFMKWFQRNSAWYDSQISKFCCCSFWFKNNDKNLHQLIIYDVLRERGVRRPSIMWQWCEGSRPVAIHYSILIK